MSETPQSLRRAYPKHWHVPGLIGAALVLLICGVTLPTLRLTKVIFFTDTYSIWRSVWELWHAEHYALAAVVLFFSIVFPFTKLTGLMAAWFVPMKARRRSRTLGWLEYLGKWSMLDVFVVAMLIVLVKAKDVADANADAGIYCFAAAVVLSILTTTMVHRRAARVSAGERSPSADPALEPEP